MDVDARYPFLSSLARQHGNRSLNQLGKTTEPKDKVLLRLSECCHCVLNDWPRWADCDAYNYLATVDAFVSTFGIDSDKSRNVWRKLGGATSTFLDTAAEAAWVLYFLSKEVSAIPEERFDASDPTSKDADLVATIDSTRYWLDVLSVDLSKWSYSAAAVTARIDLLLNKLAARAIHKYDSKFREAVNSGVLKGAWLGILVCLLKSESPRLLPLFVFQPSFPEGVFEKCEGLNWVCPHLLRGTRDSDVLQPFPIPNVQWFRPGSP